MRNYLSRYVTADSDLSEKEKFVIERLGVPAEWLYSYKALRAKYEHLYANQFQLLVKAHQWSEAHSVLVELIAPDLFLRHNFKTLAECLAPLAKEAESISKWGLGGQIYHDAIRLSHRAHLLLDFESKGEREETVRS